MTVDSKKFVDALMDRAKLLGEVAERNAGTPVGALGLLSMQFAITENYGARLCDAVEAAALSNPSGFVIDWELGKLIDSCRDQIKYNILDWNKK